MGKSPTAISYWFCFPSPSPLFKLNFYEVNFFSLDPKPEALADAASLSTQSPATFIPTGMGTWPHIKLIRVVACRVEKLREGAAKSHVPNHMAKTNMKE